MWDKRTKKQSKSRVKGIWRVTAFLTAFIFLATSVTWASPTVGRPERSEGPEILRHFVPQDDIAAALPSELGSIQEQYQASGESPLVIMIQDAHAIPDAQKNIEKLIQHFQKEYGVNRVALEGASAQLNPQIFKSFPDKEHLHEVFQKYYEDGVLTGGTASAIFSDNSSIYRGIEDWDLYEEGLVTYLQAMEQEAEILTKLTAMKEEIRKQKEKIYSKELLEVDRMIETYYDNHEHLLEVLEELAKIQKPTAGSEMALLLE